MAENSIDRKIFSEYSVPVSDFRANCARILDAVAEEGIEVVIERRGTPIAKVVPAAQGRAGLRGLLVGLAEIPPGVDIDAMKALDDDWQGAFLTRWDEELGHDATSHEHRGSSEAV